MTTLANNALELIQKYAKDIEQRKANGTLKDADVGLFVKFVLEFKSIVDQTGQLLNE